MTKQTSKQTITRDIEIKNKVSVTRGEVGGDNGGKGRRISGTSIKDTWTKPKRDRIKVGSGDGWGGGVVEGRWRQLYLNNNKKIK